MTDENPFTTEIAHQRKVALESRIRAVETQLSVAFSLCAIAETNIQLRHRDEAISAVKKIRHHTEIVAIHLDEPNHLTGDAVSNLTRQLVRLRKRTKKIESSLRQD